MSRSYTAILDGDRIRWTGPSPAQAGPLNVDVTVRGPVQSDDPARDASERGTQMAAALGRLAASGAFSDVGDPAVWQREVRRDRPLPNRPDPAAGDAP